MGGTGGEKGEGRKRREGRHPLHMTSPPAFHPRLRLAMSCVAAAQKDRLAYSEKLTGRRSTRRAGRGIQPS